MEFLRHNILHTSRDYKPLFSGIKTYSNAVHLGNHIFRYNIYETLLRRNNMKGYDIYKIIPDYKFT